MNDLSGKRILVVEDDFLIGAMVLASVSARVIGPARSKEEGVALASTELLDGAVLDVNLHWDRSDEIGVTLERRNAPFVVATGYAEISQRAWPGATIICKPFTEDRLLDALAQVLRSEDEAPEERPEPFVHPLGHASTSS